jgi:hypothetical protein
MSVLMLLLLLLLLPDTPEATDATFVLPCQLGPSETSLTAITHGTTDQVSPPHACPVPVIALL